MILRVFVGIGMLGLAYYIGRQIGRTEAAREELDQWRRKPTEHGDEPGNTARPSNEPSA